ncbi:glycosyltransferase family 4 protein [Psychroserpens sp. SPM9]|uniref:glycosyltransferase family 4 protein n=1 Tax=Psychroserpens sp. SPM9 TaxID=2975598 RepID=UPI0021A802CA|nr:glycosyltransferase family 4 protein [Psychroserpens sp. SPM9]MDG5490138.1 glycosyltransferase family 4 protein [Psychroserpens sp. SPM9]
MKNKKIKLFLGAYINSTNAQNLNCLAIAKYIDKKQFEVKAMSLYSGNLLVSDIDGVDCIKVRKPHKLLKYWAYFLGLFWCDVAYLPKGEIVSWNSFWLSLFHKKSISTVEGILDDKNLESALQTHKNYKTFLRHYKKFDKLYSITSYLKAYNFKHHGIISEDKILYLGLDLVPFLNPEKRTNDLKNIVYIGRLLERKGVYDVLDAAKAFPKLQFHLVGDGQEREAIKKHITQQQLTNVKLHGVLDHTALSTLLKTMDLHLLPSRSEGFPKVTLETAAAGVPSIVYADYGAQEWIEHRHNGFVVETLEQMFQMIQELEENSELLQLNSKNTIALGKQFDWDIVIKQWEQEISNLYHS